MLFLAASPLPFSTGDTPQWAVICVGVLATLYVVMRPKMRKKKSDPMERTAPLSVSQQRQIERDISALVVEMLETARQMTAQLDTRAARLELLIQEADTRLAALKSTGAAPALAAQTPADLPILARPAAAEPAPAAVPPTPESEAENPPDPRHADVYTMADQGRSTHEIARLLDRPNGEVELILALRPQ